MVDPLSVAGVVFAAFDQLLKLGERTTEVVDEVRHYDKDARELNERLRHQIWSTSTLKLFLFEESVTNPGSHFVDRFSEDVQDQIRISLEELHGVLNEVLPLLERLYAPRTGRSAHTLEPNDASPLDTSATLTSSNSRAALTRSPFRVLRWTFRDKKRASALVSYFERLNKRLVEKIELYSLTTTAGSGIQDLKFLQNNRYAQKLGFYDDATLLLTVADSQAAAGDLGLDHTWDSSLEHAQAVEGRFAIFEKGGKHMIVQKLSYPSVSTVDIDSQTRRRMDTLAKMLHQPKQQVFLILRCVGWKYMVETKEIAVVFETPEGYRPEPQSLLRLLGSEKMKPSLKTKFCLACDLARSITQLHMVKWVHEGLRSENILFFPAQTSAMELENMPSPLQVALDKPWLFGFDFTRPASFFSSGIGDKCMERDVYRHPDRQGDPQIPFRKVHDIYALGVVLLEIGLWEPAITLERNHFTRARSPEAVRAHLLKQAQWRLDAKMGPKYRDIVIRCLSGQFGISDNINEDLELQQVFRMEVVDGLYNIYNSL